MAQLEQPDGVRSCRDGGEWAVVADPRSGAVHMADSLDRLIALLPSPEMRAYMRREIRRCMALAAAGDCAYGDDSSDDVVRMRSTSDVLELRIGEKWYFDDGRWMQVRLFFSEPADVPGVLVAIELFWKEWGVLDAQTQSAAAGRASRLLHEGQIVE